MSLELVLTEQDNAKIKQYLANNNNLSQHEAHRAIVKMLIDDEPIHLQDICKAIFNLGTQFCGGIGTIGMTSDALWCLMDNQCSLGPVSKQVAKYFFLGAQARRDSDPEAAEYWG